MSTKKHNGDLQFSQACEIEVISEDELGNSVTKQKEFEAGKNYWIDSVTYNPGGSLDVVFADGSVGKNIPQSCASFIGTPKVTWPEKNDFKPPAAEEQPEDSAEKKKWF